MGHRLQKKFKMVLPRLQGHSNIKYTLHHGVLKKKEVRKDTGPWLINLRTCAQTTKRHQNCIFMNYAAYQLGR